MADSVGTNTRGRTFNSGLKRVPDSLSTLTERIEPSSQVHPDRGSPEVPECPTFPTYVGSQILTLPPDSGTGSDPGTPSRSDACVCAAPDANGRA
jgi:hypothetical protein